MDVLSDKNTVILGDAALLVELGMIDKQYHLNGAYLQTIDVTQVYKGMRKWLKKTADTHKSIFSKFLLNSGKFRPLLLHQSPEALVAASPFRVSWMRT